MTQKLNAKGRSFAWSFSALEAFENCPLQYAHKYFYCDLPFEETEAIIWGNRVHKAAELTLKGKEHNDPDAYAPVKSYVETMLRSGWAIDAELEIALDRKLKPVKWLSKKVWLRTKIDVVLRKSLVAVLTDWKTGKTVKESTDQIKLNIAVLSVLFPEIETFYGKYIWTAHDIVTGIGNPVSKPEIPALWEDFIAKANRLEAAWNSENFVCRTSGLCNGWCQVKSCTHWKPRR